MIFIRGLIQYGKARFDVLNAYIFTYLHEGKFELKQQVLFFFRIMQDLLKKTYCFFFSFSFSFAGTSGGVSVHLRGVRIHRPGPAHREVSNLQVENIKRDIWEAMISREKEREVKKRDRERERKVFVYTSR